MHYGVWTNLTKVTKVTKVTKWQKFSHYSIGHHQTLHISTSSDIEIPVCYTNTYFQYYMEWNLKIKKKIYSLQSKWID